MKRICFVHQDTGYAGATRSLLLLVREIPRDLFDVTVVFTAPRGPSSEEFIKLGAKCIFVPEIRTFGHCAGARPAFLSRRPWRPVTGWLFLGHEAKIVTNILAEMRPDLVYLNSAIHLPSAIAAKELGIPIIWHVREMLYRGLFGFRQRIVRRMIELRADWIITISQASKKQFARKDRIEVIYNSVDLDKFNPSVKGAQLRAELGIAPSQKVALMVGGGIRHKGADVFLEALAIAKNELPNLRAIIVGVTKTDDSPVRWKRILRRSLNHIDVMQDQLVDIIGLSRKLGLESSVISVGPVENIEQWISASDLLVFPAKVDHFARPVMEAGALGRPVIVSNGETLRELVVDGENGLLVPPSAPQELAKAMVKVLASDSLAKSLGEAGYSIAVERYDSSKNNERIVSTIKQLLRFQSAPRSAESVA